MVGAIAGGAVFIALFLLGLGVFIYLYYRSAEQPSATNLNAPAASFDSAMVERGEQEQAEKTSDASDTSLSSASVSVSAHPAPHQPSPLRRPVPAPAGSPHSPHSQPGLAIDSPQSPPPPSPSPPPRPPSAALQPQHSKRRTLQKGDPWHRQSLASSNSLDVDVPATPGNEFV